MVKGLDPNDNLKQTEGKQGQTENQQESGQKTESEVRSSNRARKAVVKEGGVMINTINKRKREEKETEKREETIFDPILGMRIRR